MTARLALTLAPSDVEHYKRERRAGRLARIDANGKTVQGTVVRARVLDEDLTFLRTVIRWATRKKKDAAGNWLLATDPLGDFNIDREKDTKRPMLKSGEYETMVTRAHEIDHFPVSGVAFHSQRRQLASDLSTAPLAMVAALGGWKHPEVAVKVYQQPSLDQQRSVLDDRERYLRGA